MKPEPNPGGVRWLTDADETTLYLSVLTRGELEKEIAKLSASARRRKIETWVKEELAERFRGRLIPVDEKVAERWEALSGELEGGALHPYGRMPRRGNGHLCWSASARP
ncbi:MAG: hypothetical protein WD118_04345 [Phycisphaeraceae bacterium]